MTDWQENVRTIRTMRGHYDDPAKIVGTFEEQHPRTAAEKHTETALTTAREHADAALAAAELALDWVASVGADVPSKFRTLPTVLRQLQAFVDDERSRRLG